MDEADYVHAANFEGERLCGATRGIKTVYAESVITCPECKEILVSSDD